MSMRDFLDGECGQNPVLKVATHFTGSDLAHSSSFRLDDTRNGPQLPPTTFRMDALLKEIHSMGHSSSSSKGPIQAPSTITELNPAWAQEFLRQDGLQQQQEQSFHDENWIGDYMAKDLDLDSVWDHHHVHDHHIDNNVRPPLSHPYIAAPFLLQQQQHDPIHAIHNPIVTGSARDLLDDSKWATDAHNIMDTQQLEKTELMITASEFLKSVSDPKIKATEFMNFVEKLSTGEIGTDGQRADSRSQRWASEYQSEMSTSEATARQNGSWADEYVTGNATRRNDGTEQKEEFWQKLNDEWEKLAHEEADTHPWLSDNSASKVNEPYQFSQESSTFKDTEDPFEEGKRKLLAGDIPAAVLLFEAAVLKDPKHAESWMFLGTTQALNEQDIHSISALNQCLQLEPNNLAALMSLASSLTNESFHLQACNALKRWLKHNDKYSYLINHDLGDSLPQTTSLLPPEELLNVQRLFMQAARINPSDGVDADVQCGLGILFNLGSDFEKAADCFQSAVTVNPENALLWNRLGATLANGGKSSEAIGAYRHALQLSPGYIRTRYNLGIACVNLGAYREAAEHFLTALNMQANGKSQTENSTVQQKPPPMSDSIWASLRTSLHLSDLSHLSKFIDSRDLDGLNREFSI